MGWNFKRVVGTLVIGQNKYLCVAKEDFGCGGLGGLGGLGDTCGADPVGLSSHILWAQSAVAGSLERQRKY